MIGDVREAIGATIASSNGYLLRIAVNNKVRVVRNQYDLSPRFSSLEVGCEQLVDRLVVEILIWLIHNEGAGIADVHAKVQDEKHDSLRAGRKLLKLNAVVFQPVAEVQVLHLVKPLQ